MYLRPCQAITVIRFLNLGPTLYQQYKGTEEAPLIIHLVPGFRHRCRVYLSLTDHALPGLTKVHTGSHTDTHTDQHKDIHICTAIRGAWWLNGTFGAFRPKGRKFESHANPLPRDLGQVFRSQLPEALRRVNSDTVSML